MKCDMCGSNDNFVCDKMGERVCDDCGFVMVSNLMEETVSPLGIRHGEFNESLQYEIGPQLGSTITPYPSVKGEYVNGKTVRRLMRTQSMFRNKNQRALVNGYMECNMVLSPYLPNHDLKHRVHNYYKRMYKARMLFSYPLTVRATAIVYVALKELGIAIGVGQIAKANNESPQAVSKCARKIARESLRKPWVLHEMPITSWLDKAGSDMKANTSFMRDARKVVYFNYEFVNARDVHFGKGLLAASLWMTSVMRSFGSYPQYGQERISDACDCTSVTLRNNHNHLLEMMDMDKKQLKMLTVNEYVAGVRYG